MARRIKKSKKIILYIVLSCLIVCLVDFFIKPVYLIKSIIKAVLFFLVPFMLLKKRDRRQLKKMITPNKNNFFKSILLGISLLTLILFLYFLLSDYYDFNKILPLLRSTGITETNFWLVCLHVSLINSLLEEFFFRGFGYLLLRKSIKKSHACIFSGIMFGLYHITIIYNWFSIPLVILAIIGLVVLGIILNILDDRSGNIYNSWMSHMFVNFGINTVGLILMGVL